MVHAADDPWRVFRNVYFPGGKVGSRKEANEATSECALFPREYVGAADGPRRAIRNVHFPGEKVGCRSGGIGAILECTLSPREYRGAGQNV